MAGNGGPAKELPMNDQTISAGSRADLLIAASPDGMILADPGGTIQVWNEAASRIFGVSADSAIGQSLDMIIPERFRQAHWRGFQESMQSGRTKYAGKALPTRATHAEGRQLYVELCFSIVHDRGGVIIGALATARDITERFLADREKDRRRQERQRAQQQPAATGQSGNDRSGARGTSDK